MQIARMLITDAGFTDAGRVFFHPKVGRYADGRLLMTVQEIGGGDYFGPVLAACSEDDGYRWSRPEPVAPLGWREIGDGVTEGVCDTVPSLDPASNRMVAVGHNVYYRNNRFYDTFGTWDAAERNAALHRRGVYSVQRADGSWGERQIFDPAEFAHCPSLLCGCSQKIIDPAGNWLIPFCFIPDLTTHISYVTVYRARFDGEKFALGEHGDILKHPAGQRVLEPSLLAFKERIYLTLRANDGYAYVTSSADGLHYEPLRPWRFDDGEPMATDTTQQHWLELGDRLYLLYERNLGYNAVVPRFRAPLLIAEVDLVTLTLKRATEQVVLPLDGDCRRPESVAYSGNFMPMRLSEHEWLVTDAQIRPEGVWRGFTIMARIYEE